MGLPKSDPRSTDSNHNFRSSDEISSGSGAMRAAAVKLPPGRAYLVADDKQIMVAPLLGYGGDDRPPSSLEDSYGDHFGCCPRKEEFIPETGRLLKLTLPSFGMYVFQALLAAVSVAFVGHLGAVELASAAIAVTVTNAGGRFVLLGLASGMETLCGQAFGAGQLVQMGEILQRGIVILNVTCVPLIGFLWNIESVLLWCRQDADVAHNSAVFAKYMVPGLLVQAWSCPLEKFLQTQGLVFPLAVASGASFIMHVPIIWFLMFKAGLGFIGAAIAISISYVTYFLGLLLWVWYFDLHVDTWHGWSSKCFHRWGEYLSLALPACVMVCLEWWCFELATIMAGLLPNPAVEVGALTICLNVLFILTMLPLGLSVAVSTRVSNELGAGNAVRARQVAMTCITLSIALASVLGGSIFVFRDEWSRLFTNDQDEEEVRILASRMFPYVAVLHVSDFIQMTLQGVLRGSGRQLIGVVVNLPAYYIVALPVAFHCSFALKLGAVGIWIGLMSGSILQSICFVIFCFRLDWKEEARRAVDSVNREEEAKEYLRPTVA